MAKRSKPKTSLRKSPRQKRSTDLVDAVMSAGTRILESLPRDMFTTNRVAELAGVSIGSLYQYFPGKDAILSKIIEDQMDQDAEAFREIIKKHGEKPAPVVLEKMISFIVDVYSTKGKMITALFTELPRLEKTNDVLKRRNKTLEIFYEFLASRKSELKDPDNIKENMYVVGNSVVGVLQVASLEEFVSYTPEQLKKKLTEMVSSFLLKS